MKTLYFVASARTNEFIARSEFDDTWTDNEDRAFDFETASDAHDYIFETAAFLGDGRGEYEVVEAVFDHGWCIRFLAESEIA